MIYIFKRSLLHCFRPGPRDVRLEVRPEGLIIIQGRDYCGLGHEGNCEVMRLYMWSVEIQALEFADGLVWERERGITHDSQVFLIWPSCMTVCCILI